MTHAEAVAAQAVPQSECPGKLSWHQFGMPGSGMAQTIVYQCQECKAWVYVAGGKAYHVDAGPVLNLGPANVRVKPVA